MANAFKTFTDTAVGTSPATIYTCPASTETTIIGLNVSNILTVSITVDVQLENADGDNVYIVKSAIAAKQTIIESILLSAYIEPYTNETIIIIPGIRLKDKILILFFCADVSKYLCFLDSCFASLIKV